MTVIVAINFIIIFLAILVSKKCELKLPIAIRIICTFIVCFTLIIIATAISKMLLYIKSFGMTELRITTSVFMLFLSVVFITLLIRLYIPKIKVLRVALITASAALILLSTVNVNSVIADYNYTAYKNGDLKEIDVAAIADLGDEGIPYLARLSFSKDNRIANNAKRRLSAAYSDYYEISEGEFTAKKHNSIGSFSISRNEAYKYLEAYYKKYPHILRYENG